MKKRIHTILNVDDNEPGRYAVTRVLEKANFIVKEAATGTEALRLAQEGPDLILLDVKLPDISGFEICRRIKEDHRTAMIPVVHLSAAYVDGENQAAGMEQGADGYLTQPVDPKVLVATINALLRLKATESALRESEARLRTMANAIPQIAWLADPSGAATWYNDRWFQYTGAKPEEMNGHSWVEYQDPSLLPLLFDRWKFSAETGTPFDMECPLRGADGIYRSFLVRMMPVKNSEGEVVQWCSTSTDISERKKIEVELRRLYEQKQADAVAKTELLNEVNHRVKNNLMMILGLILAEKRQALADHRDDINLMWEQFEARIKGLLNVHQMLSDSQWQPVSLTELAEHICTNVIDSSASLESFIDFDVQPSDIKVTPRQAGSLSLVFNELITNCVKYAFTGMDVQPCVRIRCSREGERIRVEFRDNGCGYPDKVLRDDRSNVGLRLIAQLVEHTLDGDLHLSNNGGAVTVLHFGVEVTGRT